MKIEGNRPAQDTQATDGARRAAKDAGVRQGGGAAVAVLPSDRVEVSDEAALRVAAFKAASDSPAIRIELVDTMRAKLKAGKVGHDAGALADAILDDFLK